MRARLSGITDASEGARAVGREHGYSLVCAARLHAFRQLFVPYTPTPPLSPELIVGSNGPFVPQDNYLIIDKGIQQLKLTDSTNKSD